MGSPTSYTAICRRDGGSWVVDVPGVDRWGRAGRLAQAEGVARDLVVSVTGRDPASIEVTLDLQLPEEVLDLLAAAGAARADAPGAAPTGPIARRLVAEGFAVRDVAALLDVSYAEAQELVAAEPVAAPHDGVHHPPSRSAEAKAKAHDSYRHEAVLYSGLDDFLAGTVPFVREGLARDEPVMVAVPEPRLAALHAALGLDADAVRMVDMAELGHNPARIIPGWRAFVDEYGGRPMRGIGEPIWAGRRPAELVECQFHEALLNLAVAPDTPLWLRCPYDVSSLAGSAVAEAMASHPTVVEGADYRGSTAYGGAHHVQRIFAGFLAGPADDALSVDFGREDLPAVRRLVADLAADAGLAPDRVDDLVLAVSEVATNSVRHGGGRGTLGVWATREVLVCEVRDRGRITDPMVGRCHPPLGEEGGRGLWLANQLCDLVQVRSGDAGTTVRVHAWR